MYEFLKGVLVEKRLNHLVVEVAGVGFALEAPLSTSDRLTEGASVHLLVHHHVREDAEKLYAFATRGERDLFRLLLKVTGIGPGVAVTLLSRARVEEIADAIANERVAFLKAIKGIGPKTAQRLVTELKDAVDALAPGGAAAAPAADGRTRLVEDAVQALEVLGCPAKAARSAIDRVLETDPSPSLESLVKKALRLVWPG